MMNSSKDDDDDDPSFRRDYIKKLAEALLENEQKGPHQSKQERIKDAYLALCHDDPRVDSDAALKELAANLVSTDDESTSDAACCYALSERLVDGILQATARMERNSQGGASSTTAEHNDDDEEEAAEQEPPPPDHASLSLVDSSLTAAATASGYAVLAVAVFLQIPLLCCQTQDIRQIQRYLGSYAAQSTSKEEEVVGETDIMTQEQHATATTAQVNQLAESLNQQAHLNHDDDDQDDSSLQEVFAAESDPSDFEYESEYNPQQQQQLLLQELDDWPAFDPTALSQPNPHLTFSQARRVICRLLKHLNYSTLGLGSLSSTQWKNLHMSDLLTQLTLLLLVQPSILGCNDDEQPDQRQLLRQVGVQPLFVLRDRAAAARHDNNDVWKDYLMLLQSLIAVQSATRQQIEPTKSPKTSSSTSLAPATQVGLSSLSNLCGSGGANHHYYLDRQLRQCVLETCEDLAHLLEQQQQEQQHTDDSNSTTTRLILAVLPLLDRLVNVQSDGRILAPSIGTAGVSNSEAQLLLSSGLFRALILTYARNDDKNTKDDVEESSSSTTLSFAKRHLLHCLFLLSVQSPTLLGKYVWRVPELSECLFGSTASSLHHHAVDLLLWNVLGTSVASETSTVRLNLHSKTAAAPPVLTPAQCQQECLENFSKLCRDVVLALEEIQTLRTENTSSETKLEQSHKDVVHELARFANYLVSCPNLATMWSSVVSADTETKALVDGCLSTIRKALSDLPHAPADASKSSYSPDRAVKKLADNDKAGEPISRPTPQYDEQEGMVRKSVKVLALSLQTTGGARGEQMLSSKTD